MSVYDEVDRFDTNTMLVTRTSSDRGHAYLLAYRLKSGTVCTELVTENTLQRAMDLAFDEIITDRNEAAFVDKEIDNENE